MRSIPVPLVFLFFVTFALACSTRGAARTFDAGTVDDTGTASADSGNTPDVSPPPTDTPIREELCFFEVHQDVPARASSLVWTIEIDSDRQASRMTVYDEEGGIVEVIDYDQGPELIIASVDEGGDGTVDRTQRTEVVRNDQGRPLRTEYVDVHGRTVISTYVYDEEGLFPLSRVMTTNGIPNSTTLAYDDEGHLLSQIDTPGIYGPEPDIFTMTEIEEIGARSTWRFDNDFDSDGTIDHEGRIVYENCGVYAGTPLI